MLPAEPALKQIVERCATLQARFGREFGKRPLVLPNGDFFPDRFEADRPSTQRLLERMQEHAGLRDIPVDLNLVSSDGEEQAAAHGCGGGSCATPTLAPPDQRLVPHSEGWLLQLSPGELQHPVGLTCTLARSLSAIFLIEHAEGPQNVPAPFEVSVDITATALGLGALVLEGSHVYAKSCGGPSIAQLTTLGPGELAVALVVFAHVHGQNPKHALGELSVTQRAALAEAIVWSKPQKKLLERLARDPERLLKEPVEFSQEKSFFSGLFGKKPSVDAELQRALDGELDVAQLQAPAGIARAPRPRDPARDDLRALVEEALSEQPASGAE